MEDPLANVTGTKFLELSAGFLIWSSTFFIGLSNFPIHQIAKFSDSFEFYIANESLFCGVQNHTSLPILRDTQSQ